MHATRSWLVLALTTCLVGAPLRAQDATSHCPSDSLVVVSIPNLGGAIDHARDAVETFCAHPMLNGELQEGLSEMADELGFNILQKNTWKVLGVDVSRNAAFFFKTMRDGEGNLEPAFGFVIPVTDGEALKGWIYDKVSRGGERKTEWRQEGSVWTIWRESWDGESMTQEEVALGIQGGYAVIGGSDDEALCSTIVAQALGNQSSLTQSASYVAAMKNAEPGADVVALVNLPGIFDQVAQEQIERVKRMRENIERMKKEGASADDLQWEEQWLESVEKEAAQMQNMRAMMAGISDLAVATLALGAEGARLRMTVGMDYTKDPTLRDLYTPAGPKKDLSHWMQPSMLMAFRLNMNLPAMWKRINELPAEMLDEIELDEIQEGIERELGFDLFEMITTEFGGRMSLTLGDPGDEMIEGVKSQMEDGARIDQLMMQLIPSVEAVLAMDLIRTQKVTEVLQNFLGMAGESGEVGVVPETVQGGQVWWLGPDMGGDIFQMGGVGIVDDTLVLGTKSGIQKGLARRGQAMQSRFGEKYDRYLTSDTASLLFVDLGRVGQMVRMFAPAGEGRMIAEAIFTSLDGLIAGFDVRGSVAEAVLDIRMK